MGSLQRRRRPQGRTEDRLDGTGTLLPGSDRDSRNRRSHVLARDMIQRWGVENEGKIGQ